MDKDPERKLFAPREKPERIAAMRERLERSQHGEMEEIDILGKPFKIFSSVHSPARYADAVFFAQRLLPAIRAGDRFLEVGCGIAVASVFAALKGAHVTATDVNPMAIVNAMENAKLNHVQNEVEVFLSDVYSALPSDKRFRIIYWNAPFGYVDAAADALLPHERAIFDPKHEGLRTFIMGAKAHLEEGGEIFLGYSSVLGDMDALRHYAREAGLEFTEVASMTDPDDPKAEKRFELLRAQA